MIIDYKWPTNIYKKAFPFLGHTVGRDWNFINNTRKTLCLIQVVVITRDTP